MLVWVSSSAFFSRDITHTFLFCRQRVAAARFLSRNFRLRSSGSSSTTRLRRPPLGGGECRVCVGCICCAAGDNCNGTTMLDSATRHQKPGCRPNTCLQSLFSDQSVHPTLGPLQVRVWEFSLKQHVPCTRGHAAL